MRHYISNLQIGLVMASGTALTTLLLRPMGRLSDRVSRKGLIIIGGGMAAILTFFSLLQMTFCIC